MGMCKSCGRNTNQVNEENIRTDYVIQANCFGMDSLTEEQQMLVSGELCEECCMELELN